MLTLVFTITSKKGISMVRNKLAVWLVAISVIVLVAFTVPKVTGQSWLSFSQQILEEYQELVVGGEDDDDDEYEEENEARAEFEVVLDDDALELAGLEMQQLHLVDFFPEVKGYAKVVDLRHLLNFRADYNRVQAELSLAAVNEKAAASELARLKKLNNGSGSIAIKNVNYAEADWQAKKATLQGLKFQLEDVKDMARQTWGDLIADWVLTPNSKVFERLLNREDSLLLVTLPLSASLPDDITIIRVSRDESRDHARKAYLVASAVSSDLAVQGETYYFKTETGKLRSGMHLEAWIPKTHTTIQGVFIPQTAIVWYDGEPWVYSELDEGHFKRKPVGNHEVTAGGVIAEQGFIENESIVITGAQILLSEEFSWQIVDEDDDDDD
jgi:hypothetical protein